jgi:hypothetical protein
MEIAYTSKLCQSKFVKILGLVIAFHNIYSLDTEKFNNVLRIITLIPMMKLWQCQYLYKK